MRGVFRSNDGGKTWQKVLFKDNKTGAIDLVFDPNNPHILFAALWEAQRTPWSLTSGGPGSGFFKITQQWGPPLTPGVHRVRRRGSGHRRRSGFAAPGDRE